MNNSELRKKVKWKRMNKKIAMVTRGGLMKGKSEERTHAIPRDKLESTDFEDIWRVGDYSDMNGEQNGEVV